MSFSCASIHHEPQPRDGIVDRYAAYQTRARRASADSEPLHLAFLLEPPFACTPRVEALYSQSPEELAVLSDAEFAELGIRVAPSRAERVGTYEQRKEFDRRALRLKEQFSSFRGLLREKRWEDAHDLLAELNPGGREANLSGLAQLLLNSSDPTAQRYGRRCLDRIEGADPVTAFDAHLLAGAVALRERRWAEASSHYRASISKLPDLHSRLPEGEVQRRVRETYLSRVYLDERLGNYERGLNYVDMVIAIEPDDRTALLHKTVLLLMRGGRASENRIAEARTFFAAAFPASINVGAVSGSPPDELPELLFAELQLKTFGAAPETVERWEKTSAEMIARGLSPRVEAMVRLKSAEMQAAQGNHDAARENLVAAERLDRVAVEAAPQWPSLLFMISDARAAKVLGERFYADPKDHASGRMLSLVLLESADARDRGRGAAIAELLYLGNPKSVPLIVAAADAHFMLGRNDDAVRLVEPLVGIFEPSTWEQKLGRLPDERRVYEIDARAFSPFDFEHQQKAWLITQAGDVLKQEQQELQQSPLSIESSEAEPPSPVILSADDAYLVARILFRTSGAKSPERIVRARALLEWLVKTPEPTRYRNAAAQLRVATENATPQDGIRSLDGGSEILRGPLSAYSDRSGIDLPTVRAFGESRQPR